MKKEIKRKELLKKLINKMIEDNSLPKKLIKISIQPNSKKSSCIKYRYTDESCLVVKADILLNLKSFKCQTKNGYTDFYYKGRKEKLKSLKNNRHLHHRFVMLHELGHFIDTSQMVKNEVNPNKIPLKIKEQFADNFALHNLERYK